ncbi:MAG: hypothetical protein J6Q96_07375, partial [Bacteroidales bacterium]|nr:hypothetical protein [Bacteroidales bacterium]
MKRSIILLLVLLPIVAFSQMQNIINQGNTATTQRRVGGNNTIDSSLIKIRSIDAHRLLVSMPDSSSIQTVFSYSTMGTNATTLLTFPNLKIYDFKIFAGNIYFCGRDNTGTGFISWMTLNNLFSTNPQAFTVQKITNPIKPKAVTDLEVYKWDDSIHVVALADNRFLIDMNTFNPSTYQIMQSGNNPLKKISVGDKKIVTLRQINDTLLVITAFDKGNISQYMYRGFTHPELRYNKYVLENSMTNEDIFTFGYTHREYTNNNYYKTDFATFEVTNGIHIINKQYLEIPDGKLEPIDLEFCQEDSTLLYLAGGNYGHDEIFPIKHFVHNDYVINTIQPNCSISNPIKQYNSIIRYEDYYFAAFAKDTPSSRGVIFDCKRDVSSFLNCASSNSAKVINDFFLG